MDRGRGAASPTEIPAAGWKDIALRAKDRNAENHVGLIAAGVAFYGILALFPAITALIAIGGLILEPGQIVGQLDRLSGILPPQVAEIIIGQAEGVAGSSSGGLGLAAIFGILLALWSASKGVGSLMQGLNIVYEEDESRSFLHLAALRLGLTLLLILGLVVALAATTVIPVALALVPVDGASGILITAATWVLMAALTILGLGLIYRIGPSREKARFRWLSVGAVVACVVWIAASGGFAIYVANFGTYNESFGSLGGIIVLLLWLWISAYVVLLGAVLNAEIEAQTRRDTTTGKPMPMGERGARMADELGAAQR
jgi:membrane protein